MTIEQIEKPPKNAKRVYRWADLASKERATYPVSDQNQEPREISVANNQRRVLEGLLQGPIYAASYCRLSDQVLPLRRDKGISISCKMCRNDPDTGRESYGVYFLESKVSRVSDEEVAA